MTALFDAALNDADLLDESNLDGTASDPKNDAPAITFGDLGLPAPLVTARTRSGISTPFPIQVETIPDALAGHDIGVSLEFLRAFVDGSPSGQALARRIALSD